MNTSKLYVPDGEVLSKAGWQMLVCLSAAINMVLSSLIFRLTILPVKTSTTTARWDCPVISIPPSYRSSWIYFWKIVHSGGTPALATICYSTKLKKNRPADDISRSKKYGKVSKSNSKNHSAGFKLDSKDITSIICHLDFLIPLSKFCHTYSHMHELSKVMSNQC